MKLHLNKELFENYIALASQEEEIDDFFQKLIV